MTGVPAPVRNDLQAALGAAYTIERELGGGGMSRVFVATDVRLDRKIVVKVLHPELAAGLSAERFTREIRLAAQLQQANVVPVLADGVTSDGLPYYTMPFVEGLSLRQRLGRGPLGIQEIVSILRDVARALVYAHGRGVVHRDIKPECIAGMTIVCSAGGEDGKGTRRASARRAAGASWRAIRSWKSPHPGGW